MNNISETTTPIENTTEKTIKTNKYNARDLIGLKSEASIILDDQIYILRITKQNKLILTK